MLGRFVGFLDGLRVGLLLNGFVDARRMDGGNSTLDSTLGSVVGKSDDVLEEEEEEVGSMEGRW
jgi:hypothetical protein